MFVPHYQSIWKEFNMIELDKKEADIALCHSVLRRQFDYLTFITPEQALEVLTDCYNDLNVLTDCKYEDELAEYTKELIDQYEVDFYNCSEEEE